MMQSLPKKAVAVKTQDKIKSNSSCQKAGVTKTEYLSQSQNSRIQIDLAIYKRPDWLKY